MTESFFSYFRTALGFIALALATGSIAQAQTPDDASDGVVLVHTLAGATAADKIAACIQVFATSSDPAGTCDARGLPGGVIDYRVVVNVPGLKLTLGGGTYQILNDGGFRLTADGTVIEGQGYETLLDASLKTGASAVVDLWNANGQQIERVVARDLQITGVKNDVLGGGFVGARTNNSRYATLASLTISNSDAAAIAIHNSEDTQVHGCAISEITRNGIQVTGTSQRVQVFNNAIHRAGLGADLSAGFGAITIIGSNSDGPAPSWVRVAENTISEYGGGGVRVTRVGGSIPTNVQIVANQVNHIAAELINSENPTATYDGEGIGNSGNNVQILGNRVRGAYVNGIAIYLDRPGAIVENVTISGNMVSNSSQMPGGANVHNGVGLLMLDGLGRNFAITDNILFDDQSTPSQGFAVSLNPGTRTPSQAVDNLFIDGNIGFGNKFASTLNPAAASVAVTTGNVP